MNIKSRKYRIGAVTVVPETIDDLYVLYNIISPNDQVKARTFRRLRQTDENGRADKGERVPMILTLVVEEAKFHEFANRLRIKGKIIAGPEDLISLGTYHTINTETGTFLTIIKEFWTKVDKNTLDDSEATLASVGAFNSAIIAHFKERIPKKSGGKAKTRAEMIGKFYAKITFAINEAVGSKDSDISAMVLAGPGFTKDNYYRYLKDSRTLTALPLEKIILERASCGGPSAIGEIVSKNILGRIMEEEQASSEAVYVEEVLSRIGKNTGTVAYGKEAIVKALEFGAIETFLIVDRELRLREKDKRIALDRLLDAVQKNGGKVVILSENHDAGRQVVKFGGRIALLRFPVS
ncbi:MAG: pelota family protein [Candidatus Heimdallarchaeota archaeon]